MAKSTKVPDTLKIKLVLEVDKELYDRIVANAKEQGLPGTVESVLKDNNMAWFEQWRKLLDAKDAQTDGAGLVAADGKPLVIGPGGDA